MPTLILYPLAIIGFVTLLAGAKLGLEVWRWQRR